MSEFQLAIGEVYAIQPDNASAHIAGKYLGTVDMYLGADAWLAFDTAGDDDPRIRFFNPDHIRSLLPEKTP